MNIGELYSELNNIYTNSIHIDQIYSINDDITLNSNISGLNSISGTTINATSTLTENNIRVATQPFAIAQSIALG